MKMIVRSLIAAGCLASLSVQAESVSLDQAVEMSLAADPRIKEREQVVAAARALVEEVRGNAGWRVSAVIRPAPDAMRSPPR